MKNSKTPYFIIKNEASRAYLSNRDIDELFISPEYGIIKFKTLDGIMWERQW